MKYGRWVLTTLTAMTVAALLPGTPLAKPPVPEPTDEADFDEMTPDTPLPPGLSERVFIHLPRTTRPGSLGTCVPTTNAKVNDFGLAGWQLPTGGITWQLNASTVPPTVGVDTAINALTSAFGAWTGADHAEQFSYGGATSVRRPRADFVNAVLWGKISAGAIAITYVRYYTSTGILADVDTVFNSHYPWAIFDAALGDCASSPNAYDVQDIATHEFGHWVGLDDLYNSADSDLTMYGYGAGGELKKRTLGTGDISGANTVAP